MNHYADSSFLVSCYILDTNTSQAKAWLSRAAVTLPWTELHRLEVRNALELGVFRGVLARNDATLAHQNLQGDVRSGLLERTKVKWPVTFRLAARLSERHSAAVGTRSLDVLHVAAAKALRAREFVSFDARQRALAAAIGLKVAP